MAPGGEKVLGGASGSSASPDSCGYAVEIKTCEDVMSTEVESGGGKPELSRYEWWLTSITFFFLGGCSVFAWSNVLYLMPHIAKLFLDNYDAGNSLLGAYQVGNFLTQLLLLFLGTMRQGWIHLGLVLGSVLCGTFGPCVIYGSLALRKVLLHVLCLFLGSGSGFMQGSGFSIAAILPVNQVGMYSSGQGFSAIFSILLIGVCSFSVLDITKNDDLAILIHVTCAVTVLVGIATMVLTVACLRQPAAKRAFEDAKAGKEDDTCGDRVELGKGSAAAAAAREKSLFQVLKQAWVPVFCIFAIFFMTCNLFPRVGPTQWRITNPPKNHMVWLFGIFPFGDTLGKCLCTGAHKMGKLKNVILFPPKLLPWATVVRALVYVPFFLSKHLDDNALFNAFWFQLILMAILSASHGWLATVGFMYSFDAVPDVRDKRRVGPLGILSLIVGIMTGLYVALLFK